MAINVGDAILKIKGDSSQLNLALSQAERRTQDSMKKMQDRVRMAGVAFTALGAAGLKMADSAKKMNAQLSVTALSLGVTTKEMRDLALSATNVTFPLEEVTASFDLLTRSGERDTEVIKAVATAFDTLGDATGNSASKTTAIMIPAMKTFHLTAEEAADKIDMMTFMVRNSTTSLEDFNTMVGYTDQEMVAAGLTIDDMAAAMMWMADNGIAPGRVMLREWNKAVTQSKKEGIALTEALGMTSAELEIYKGNLEGATGAAQAFADEANKQYGFMDKLKQKFSELTLQLGSYLEPLEPILAGMTALGPLLIMASMKAELLTAAYWKMTAAKIAHTIATKAAAIAQWALNVAMSANPIGLIIVAIGALVAATVWMIKNWDKVVKFFKDAWDKIKLFFWKGTEWVLKIAEKLLGWIPGLGDKIRKVREGFQTMIDKEELRQDANSAEASLKRVEAAIDDNTVATDNWSRSTAELTDAQKENIETLKKQREELEEQKTAYEKLIEEIEETREALAYEDSTAGKLGVTLNDVERYLVRMGWTTDDIAKGYQALGDDVDNVNSVLAYFRLTAEEVNDALKEQKADIDATTDAYDKQAEAVDNALTKQQEYLDLAEEARKMYPGAAPLTAGVAPEAFTPAYYQLLAQNAATQSRVQSAMATSLAAINAQAAAEGLGVRKTATGAWMPMATGGIVTSPTPIIAGESGPEAIIPLNQLDRKADIRVYLDERVLMEALGQRIVDEVFLRHGVVL